MSRDEHQSNDDSPMTGMKIPSGVETHGDYHVVDRGDHETSWGRFTHIEIHRIDDSPTHNWYDLFQLKNELFGEDRAALEVYPPAERLVDDTNSYHLWVLEEDADLPFGIHDHDATNQGTIVPRERPDTDEPDG